MRNKILALIPIVLMVQFLMPALALAEDLPAVDQPAATEITLQSESVITEPVVTEPIVIEPVVIENDTTEAPIDLTQPEPMVAVVESAPLVEAVPSVDYELPNNPLCSGITGDLNGDGLINEYDEEVIKMMVKGQEPFDACADLDGDGFIGSGDISQLTATYKIFMPAYGIVLQPKDFSVNTASAAAGNSCTLGDANGDNKIDYKDVGLLLQMMKGELPGAPAADLDGDGYISPADWSQLEFKTRFTHKVSADVTAEEKGNCDVPTASILYSKDNGANYATSIKVKKGDTLTIKAVFSKPLNEFEYAFLDIDNGLPTDNFMKKDNALESTFNLVVERNDNLIAAVSIRAINGIFTDDIILTSGLTFVIENKNEDNNDNNQGNGSGSGVGGSYPVCEIVNFSEWSLPVEGKITREVTSKVPFDCELTAAQKSDMVKAYIEEEPIVEAQVLGEKAYADGTLLRAYDQAKIYVLENGFKRHIKTLKELATKYFGQTIVNVSPEVLDQYPTLQ